MKEICPLRYFLLLPGLVAIAIVYAGCTFSSSYGLKEIVIDNNGGKIYVKYLSRGFSYEAISLSTDDNYCAEPRKDSEYVFTEGVEKRFLFLDGHLYLLVDLPEEKLGSKFPVRGNFPTPIHLVSLKSEKGQEFIKKYGIGSLGDLNIPPNRNLQCWF